MHLIHDHPKMPLGSRMREARKRRGWTLETLSGLTGISASALSKAENGKIALGYGNLQKVARGLGIEIAELFTPLQHEAAGRRSHSRPQNARTVRIPGYLMKYLATDLVAKRFVPMLVTVKARTVTEAGGLKHHGGEEVYYVISGTAVLHTSAYAPLTVKAGECVYMDGRVGHAFVTKGSTPAKIFSVNEGYPVFSAESGELCIY